MVAAGFLKSLIRTVPYKIHTVLTDNGVQFAQFERGSGLIFPHSSVVSPRRMVSSIG